MEAWSLGVIKVRWRNFISAEGADAWMQSQQSQKQWRKKKIAAGRMHRNA